jgi:hypothetical protein
MYPPDQAGTSRWAGIETEQQPYGIGHDRRFDQMIVAGSDQSRDHRAEIAAGSG